VSSSPTSSPAPGNGAAADKTLHIYTWSDYFDDQLLQDFKEKTGIRVVADILDSNETMLAKLQAGGGSAYSIIYPSDYMVTQMIEEDMLMSIDQSQLPSVDLLFKQWQTPAYDPGNEHSYPFVWGTTGIVYNTEVLEPEPEDWQYLWDNVDQLERRMTLINDMREVFGVALKSLGYSNSTTNENEIKQAYEKLRELKPAINSFTTDGWRDQIVVGDLVLSQVYSSDGIDAITGNPQLKYIIPTSGATVWTDTIAIPKTAPNVEAAYLWMNYVLSPETAAPLTKRLRFATPNQEVLAQLPNELKNNTSLFPPDEVLAKCEVLAPVDEAIDLYDRYWTELTSV
jgi:spermidine/putrescine transport system substrate-binding protein